MRPGKGTITDPMKLLASICGLYVATHAPGDGVRRYRFFDHPSDYHSGRELFTALGRTEAVTWLRGYQAGRESLHSSRR